MRDTFFRLDEVQLDAVAIAPLRFLPRSLIHLVSYSTDMIINDLSQPVSDAQRLVLRQCMPGRERKIFTKCVLFGSVECLLQDTDSGHWVERGLSFFPLYTGIFHIHAARSSRLHQEFHARLTLL